MVNNQEQVYYTGIGANDTGIHTKNEFLEIMHNHVKTRNTYRHRFRKYNLPNDFDKFDFVTWLKYSGASLE